MADSMHRAKFEAWAQDRGMPVHRREFPGSERLGEYGNAYTQQCWEAWQASVPDELRAIGTLIATQDNRITDQPIFIVQQKVEYPADADYEHGCRIAWIDDGGEEADDETAEVLEQHHAAHGGEPDGWNRVFLASRWEFVTACFTEQGCKDYIAANGHNLREPRIYADVSYRNAEFRRVRDFLIGLHQPQEADHG